MLKLVKEISTYLGEMDMTPEKRHLALNMALAKALVFKLDLPSSELGEESIQGYYKKIHELEVKNKLSDLNESMPIKITEVLDLCSSLYVLRYRIAYKCEMISVGQLVGLSHICNVAPESLDFNLEDEAFLRLERMLIGEF